MNKRDLIKLRDAYPTDLPFIYRSILMGTYHGNRPAKGSSVSPKCPVDFFSSIDQDTFMKAYHKHIEILLARADVGVKIACLVEDPDVILGFSVFSPGTIHFVFVKPQWRRIGIGGDLLPNNISNVSGFTRVGDVIRRKKGWGFNPWA